MSHELSEAPLQPDSTGERPTRRSVGTLVLTVAKPVGGERHSAPCLGYTMNKKELNNNNDNRSLE